MDACLYFSLWFLKLDFSGWLSAVVWVSSCLIFLDFTSMPHLLQKCNKTVCFKWQCDSRFNSVLISTVKCVLGRWNSMNLTVALAAYTILSTLLFSLSFQCLRTKLKFAVSTMTFIYKQGASPCDDNNAFIILKWQLNGGVLVRTVGFVLYFACVCSLRWVVPLFVCVCAKRGIWTLSNGERDVMWWDSYRSVSRCATARSNSTDFPNGRSNVDLILIICHCYLVTRVPTCWWRLYTLFPCDFKFSPF